MGNTMLNECDMVKLEKMISDELFGGEKVPLEYENFCKKIITLNVELEKELNIKKAIIYSYENLIGGLIISKAINVSKEEEEEDYEQ